MGVDLGFVLHAVGADAERFHRPVQVGLPLRATQGQSLAQGGFIDLDDAHPGPLQVQHFLADGQCQLQAGHRARLVVTHKGPVQDRDRAGQHALHRLVGQRLCIADPFDRHRFRPADIAKQDRRFDAARAIGLHPAELAERIAIQLLAEVFDHVIALGLAMHQNIQSQRFLLADAVGNLRLYCRPVGGFAQFPGLVLTANLADFRCLRE